MLVSVLSGLARSDVDPWQEAAKLAQLPGETATKELAALIDALPDRAVSYPDPRAIAIRLIALLPHKLGTSGGRKQTPHSASVVMTSRPWWIYAAFIGFMLGSQLLIASHHVLAKPDIAEVKAASTSSSPAANSGQ